VEYNYLFTCRTRLLDRFFLEMPGVTQREIVTDGLSCLSKKKNVQTGSRVIRLSSPRCNFTRVLNIKIKNRMWKLHMTDSWERQGEKGFCCSTSQKRNSRDVQKKHYYWGKEYRYTIYDSITCSMCIVEIAVFINVSSFLLQFWNELDSLINDIVNTICPNSGFSINFGIQFNNTFVQYTYPDIKNSSFNR